MANTNGLTTPFMMATGTTIISKDTGSTDGQTAEFTLGIGKITRCMVEVSTSGQMEGDTKDSTRMTESMALVFTSGPMVKSMKANGSTVNNMEKVESQLLRERANLACGKTATGSNGWMINRQSGQIVSKTSLSRSKLNLNYLLITSHQ
jgi:hypothetical protein